MSFIVQFLKLLDKIQITVYTYYYTINFHVFRFHTQEDQMAFFDFQEVAKLWNKFEVKEMCTTFKNDVPDVSTLFLQQLNTNHLFKKEFRKISSKMELRATIA